MVLLRLANMLYYSGPVLTSTSKMLLDDTFVGLVKDCTSWLNSYCQEQS